MEEKARNRLKLFCLNAKRLPTMIVRSDSIKRILYHTSARGLKVVYRTETKTNNTAAFETTDRYEVTATGAPSYTSAVHRWNGTAEILKENPDINKINAKICKGAPFKWVVNILYVNVPEVPYNKEIPNNNNPDENADEMISFIAASDD